MSCCDECRHKIVANLARNSRRETTDGIDYLVVPVVMARIGVEMNGALIDEAELFPASWNGVPVTLGHPETETLTANTPQALEKWGLGRIFNAHLDDGALKGEAWIDIAKADKLRPGLIQILENPDAPMDVSTGFFSATEEGGDGVARRTDIKPDHLALLPDERGACSWDDGCGVRANKRGDDMKGDKGKLQQAWDKIAAIINGADDDEAKKAIKVITPTLNLRGDDDDARQMVADLISNDDSPFVPDDEDSLRMMSRDTLAKMRDSFIKTKPNAEDDDDPDPDAETNEGKRMNGDRNASTNAVREFLTKHKAPKAVLAAVDALAVEPAAPKLSDEDAAALAHAKAMAKQHRSGLIDKIVANSDLTAEEVADFDTPRLEKVANGLRPAPDYGGRGMAASVNADAGDDEIKAMSSGGVVQVFRDAARNGGEK